MEMQASLCRGFAGVAVWTASDASWCDMVVTEASLSSKSPCKMHETAMAGACSLLLDCVPGAFSASKLVLLLAAGPANPVPRVCVDISSSSGPRNTAASIGATVMAPNSLRPSFASLSFPPLPTTRYKQGCRGFSL